MAIIGATDDILEDNERPMVINHQLKIKYEK